MSASDRAFTAIGAVSGLLSVAAGAFGAHALRHRVAADALALWETGARYQMYHALGLLAAAWVASRWPGWGVNAAGWLFVLGTLTFSGSLYALALSGVRALGAVTPIGGAALVCGWALLAWAAIGGR